MKTKTYQEINNAIIKIDFSQSEKALFEERSVSLDTKELHKPYINEVSAKAYANYYLADKNHNMIAKNYWLMQILKTDSYVRRTCDYYANKFWYNYGMEKMEKAYETIGYEGFCDMLYQYFLKKMVYIDFSAKFDFKDVGEIYNHLGIWKKRFMKTLTFAYKEAVSVVMIPYIQKFYPHVTRMYLDGYNAMRIRGFDFNEHTTKEAIEFASKMEGVKPLSPITVRRICYIFGYDTNGDKWPKKSDGKPTKEERKEARRLERVAKAEEKIRAKNILDHKGVYYRNITEIAKAYDTNRNFIEKHKNRGKSYAEITRDIEDGRIIVPGHVDRTSCKYRKDRPKVDHLGNEYPSFSKMCEAYNRCFDVVAKRLDEGDTIEQALTLSPERKKKYNKKSWADHKGIEYPNKSALTRAYNISNGVFDHRIKSGWSLEDALTTEVAPRKRKNS